MYQVLEDMQTRKTCFVPARTSNDAFKPDSYDYQLDLTKPKVDHTRPTPFSRWMFDQHNHIVTTDAEPTISTLRIPASFKRNGRFCKDMIRTFKDVCQQQDDIEALRQMTDANHRLNQFNYSAAMDDDDIRTLAADKSKQFMRLGISATR